MTATKATSYKCRVISIAWGDGGLPERPCLIRLYGLRSGQMSEFAPMRPYLSSPGLLQTTDIWPRNAGADRQGLEERASKPLRRMRIDEMSCASYIPTYVPKNP